jgi:protein involved in polysaccharide export with SLBB domain
MAPPQHSLGGALPQAAASAPQEGGMVSPPADYVLQPGDWVSVRFHYHPTYDQDIIVRPDGKVVLPHVGELAVAGQKPADLGKQIAQGYADILRDPEVEVQIKQFAGQRIYVGGEVMKPGFVNLSAGMTTLQAVVEAGGFKDSARLSNIVVVRGYTKTEGAKPEGLLVNLQEVLEGHDLAKDLPLQPYDVVFVPKTAIAKANQFVDQYLVRMLPIRPGVGIGF